MNDLDTAIRRAFDELVNAAPPPPSAPNPTVRYMTSPDPRGARLLAVAASVLVVAAFGMIVYTQRNGTAPTISTSDQPRSSEVATTQPPQESVASEPILIREETGGSPEPVTSVELAPRGEYEIISSPSFPGTTEPVPAAGESYAGIYFAYLHEGAGPDDPLQLRFDVVQAYTGQDCVDRFGDSSPSVCSPFGTDINGPVGQVDLAVTEVPISVRNVASEFSHLISGTELIALINGATPSASAPDGYLFSGGYGFLLTFDNGSLTRIDQPGSQ